MRRHSVTRKVTNILLIAALGAGLGWLITGQGDRGAFSPRASGPTTPGVSSTLEKTDGFPTSSVNGYKQISGPFAVREVSDVVLRDAKRNRELHVRVLFPAPPGRYPVVLFSGNPDCCAAQLRSWGTHGYVIVQLATESFGPSREGEAIEMVQLRRGKRQLSNASPVWENHPLDVSFVIDSIAELQNRIPQLRHKPDRDHIGVAGEGTGAFGAEVIAGAVIDLPGHPRTNLADPRVRAVLCFSPQGPGHFGLTAESFDQLVLPYLGVPEPTTLDVKRNEGVARRVPFERSQPGDKYELSIEQDHSAVRRVKNAAAIPQDGDIGEEDSASALVHSAALAFWDAYLKHDVMARRYLQSDMLEKASKGNVKLERR